MTTRYLPTQSSFWEGVARILDFGNLLNDRAVARGEGVADYRAIQADWNTVADDLWAAIAALETEEPAAARVRDIFNQHKIADPTMREALERFYAEVDEKLRDLRELNTPRSLPVQHQDNPQDPANDEAV